jgi:type III restriction enzyme
LQDAKIEKNYKYELKTGEIKEEIILDEVKRLKSPKGVVRGKIVYKVSDFGENITRCALDKLEFYKFETLKRYFPHIKSIKEFISSDDYLGSAEIEVSGPKTKINELTPIEKLKLLLFLCKKIAEQARTNTSEFIGTELFKARMLRDVFKDKKIKIDIDDLQRRELEDVNLAEKDWYAQSGFYGTGEEQSFIRFIDENLLRS